MNVIERRSRPRWTQRSAATDTPTRLPPGPVRVTIRSPRVGAARMADVARLRCLVSAGRPTPCRYVSTVRE